MSKTHLEYEIDCYERLVGILGRIAIGKFEPPNNMSPSDVVRSLTHANDILEHYLYFVREYPEHSGISGAPVNHPTLDAFQAWFDMDIANWEGDYGQANRDFCLWLTEKFQRTLDNKRVGLANSQANQWGN